MLYQMLGQEQRSDTGGIPKLPAFLCLCLQQFLDLFLQVFRLCPRSVIANDMAVPVDEKFIEIPCNFLLACLLEQFGKQRVHFFPFHFAFF